MVRTYLRANGLDRDDQYEFSQIVVDGYSGGELNDGYLTGILLKVGSTAGPGSTTLELHSNDGEINQTGTGNVTFSGNVLAKQDVTITGDLTVNGTKTELNVETLVVEDPIMVINSVPTLTGDWTGISGRDDDGYNRLGFIFDSALTDGYWALSTNSGLNPDANPDRSIAYIGAGDSYGDLSSTISGNSGAGKIAISAVSGLTSGDVQAAIEELNSAIGGSPNIIGTSNIDFSINNNATAVTDEDPCLILKGGDGTNLIEGYMCLVTDSANGDRFQFNIYESTSQNEIDVHLGPLGMVTDMDSVLTFNSGDGSNARTAEIRLDGTDSRLEFTADSNQFNGSVEFVNNAFVDGRFDAYGNVRVGNASTDTLQIDSTIISDLLPTDCTYALGRPSNAWDDGYFCLFTPTNYTSVGNAQSLEGHLKGIDDALANVDITPPRGVYNITNAEASSDELDTSRTIDFGDQTAVGSFTDSEFLKYVHVYVNGQLKLADVTSRANSATIVNDYARKTGSLNTVIFYRLRKSAVVTIIDFT